MPSKKSASCVILNFVIKKNPHFADFFVSNFIFYRFTKTSKKVQISGVKIFFYYITFFACVDSFFFDKIYIKEVDFQEKI
ncbi:MAG: VanZ family protein [Alphaproteobacteria bacterium]|nr:VanZ family protein [Alphaproteobacteria bacterium]